jgi:hypothetical protein
MGKGKRKAKLKTVPWGAAAYLKNDKDIAHYLEAVFEDGDPSLVAAAWVMLLAPRAWRESRTLRALVGRAFIRRYQRG